MSNYHPLEVVGRASETQLEEGGNLNYITSKVNPYPAELLQLYFSSFEAGIANAISSFK